jgi:peptide/nickel transport system substrate-binding protein
MRTKHLIAVAAMAVTAAFAFTGCAGSSGGSSSSSSATKSDITVAVSALATTYDWEAAQQFTNENFTVISQTQAGLLTNPYTKSTTTPSVQQMDFTKYQGLLADGKKPYTISGNDYTLHLRKNVKSQAGNPLTAEDVKWSFERKFAFKNSGLAALSPYLTSPDQIEVVDDHTVTFHFHNSDSGNIILAFLAGMNGRIYDKTELLKHATSDDPYAVKWSANHSGWGFGPYTVTSVTPDQQMVLTASKNYALGEPIVKKVTLKVVANSGTRAQLLRAGSVDLAEGLTPTDSNALSSASNIVVPKVANPIEFADLALVSNKAPFNDEKVRQAFRYAVPYDKIIKQIYKGRATDRQSWFSPSISGLNEKVTYTYNPKKAKALLSEAGKSDVDLTLHVSNAVPDLIDMAVLIKSEAAAAGFNVSVQQDNAGDFATGRGANTFQALLFANRAQIQLPIYVPKTFFNPANAANNNSAFQPPSNWDSLLSSAVAVEDPFSAAAGKVWNQVQEAIDTDAGNMPVVYKQPNQAYRKTVSNVSYRFDNTIDYSILKVTK